MSEEKEARRMGRDPREAGSRIGHDSSEGALCANSTHEFKLLHCNMRVNLRRLLRIFSIRLKTISPYSLLFARLLGCEFEFVAESDNFVLLLLSVFDIAR